jgi:tetratricopeptide (TPR) repeat protein
VQRHRTLPKLQEVQARQQEQLQKDLVAGNSALVGSTPAQTAKKVSASLPAPSKETTVTYIDLGDYELTNGLYEEAIKTYTLALDTATAGEQKMTLYIGIGEAYKATGNNQKAKDNFLLAYNQIANGDESYTAMKKDLKARYDAL